MFDGTLNLATTNRKMQQEEYSDCDHIFQELWSKLVQNNIHFTAHTYWILQLVGAARIYERRETEVMLTTWKRESVV